MDIVRWKRVYVTLIIYAWCWRGKMLNIAELQKIIKLVDASGIEEFDYETNGSKVHIKKSQSNNTQSQIQTSQAQPVAQKAANLPEQDVKTIEETVEVTPDTPQAETPADYDYEIKSPMVGTFYRSSSPENDPFTDVGQTVNNNSVVCIVEAMKLFNEIEAEVSGEIVEVLVDDSELVEYGQPLFRVKKK